MQSVKSTQVQKPVLQTAVAPTSPQIPSPTNNPAPPSYTASLQQKQQTSASGSAGTTAVPTTEPPSYASTMQAKAKAVHRGLVHPPSLPPPPPYSDDGLATAQVATVECNAAPKASSHIHPPLQRKFSPAVSSDARSDSPQSVNSCDGRLPPGYPDNGAPPLPPTG